MDQSPNATVSEQLTETTRKEYRTPTLTDFGSFAELTQASAAPSGTDSGVYS